MYIVGHYIILTELLENFKENTFDIERLRQGLLYPDLPCGKYEFQGTKVSMVDKHVCSIKDIKSLLHTNYFKPLFQSHRGVYAFLHSMSWDPSLNVKQVRDKIIQYIMNFVVLSVYDDNIFKKPLRNDLIKSNEFWIGIVLHIIMDSYSKAHTIRLNIPTKTPSQKYFLKHKAFKDEIKNVLINIKNNIYNPQELKEVLFTKFDKEEERIYITKRIKYIYATYKMNVFDKQIKNVSKNFFKKKSVKVKTKNTYDITNFQYYNDQKSLYHKQYDFLLYVRKYKGLYERMIQECKVVLDLFKQVKEGHLTPKQYANQIYTHLVSHTFHIADDDLKQKTGVVYDTQ